MSKRIIALFLSVMMLCSVMLISVSAETGPTVEITASNTSIEQSSSAKKITFKVLLKNPNPVENDVAAIDFNLKSDSEHLVLESDLNSRTDDFDMVSYRNSKFVAINIDTNNMTTHPIDGEELELLTIEATLSANAPVGTYKIFTDGMAVSDTTGMASIYSTNPFCEITVTARQTGGNSGFGGGGVIAKKYELSFDTMGGTAIPAAKFNENTLVDLTKYTTVKEGFRFDGWCVDKELAKSITSIKLTKDVTIYAKWVEVGGKPGDVENDECDGTKTDNCPAADFTDVDTNAWYHLNIDYVLENGLMKGTSTDKFEPGGSLTRAMLVTVLYRADGEPEVNNSISFADVEMGSYYQNAVAWAQQKDIVNGITETTFAPNDDITREQIAVILYRYAIYKGMDAVNLSENLGFKDADDISEYAISALNWAVGEGLIKGYEDNTVRPQRNATRAETAALLQRFLESDK